MSMSAEPVITYLRKLQAQGRSHISIDDEARQILRKFYQRALGKPAASPTPVATKPLTQAQQTTVTESLLTTPKQAVETNPPSASPDTADPITYSSHTPADKLTELKSYTTRFPAAKALGTLRQTMVFSSGAADAEVMIVGEAPGFDDERLGEPFIGKAGQKLTGILQAMGIKREDCYLTNLVKYRPASANQTTMTRKPSDQEITAFLPIFHEEIKTVAPKVIIALGAKAGQTLAASSSSVGELRGEFHQYQDIALRVTYHPSYILQEGNTPEKRELWEDMLAVMGLLNIPISEKQQGYFKQK